MAFHENPRFTDVIDILVKESDLKRVEELLGNLIFFKSTDPHHFLKVNLILHRFVKTKGSDYLVVDILCGKENTFNSIFENTVKTEWEKSVVCIASRDDLIQLKKFRNSDQDKIDIKNLDKNEIKQRLKKSGKA